MREWFFPSRAAVPSGKQLTHRPQSQMSVSGLCTRVPGTARVWSAAADTPQSTQTVSCGLRQRLIGGRGPEKCFFSQQGEQSECSAITLPDTRGWSTESDRWKWGHAVPWGRPPARGFAQSDTV